MIDIRFQKAAIGTKLLRLRHFISFPQYFVLQIFRGASFRQAYDVSIELIQFKMNWLYDWAECYPENQICKDDDTHRIDM